MNVERIAGGTCVSPFPLYDGLVDTLMNAHQGQGGEGDAAVAHVLATCAGYAYADVGTVEMMMARMGLEANACVGISQTVDAMMIFSTAYLVQSRCGRVVVLCYRGTEPGSLGNWLGDLDIGPGSSTIAAPEGGDAVRVHAVGRGSLLTFVSTPCMWFSRRPQVYRCAPSRTRRHPRRAHPPSTEARLPLSSTA